MSCIGEISAGLGMSCGTPCRADLSKPVSAKILNAAAIESFTVDPDSVASITRVPGKVGYDVTVDNNSLVVTVGLKSQDIIPGAYDVAITFKSFSGAHTLASAGGPLGFADKLLRAELVIAIDHGDAIRVYGLGVPLVCTEMSGDSSASAYVTYTFGVEDWQVGSTIHYMNRKDYDALSSPAE